MNPSIEKLLADYHSRTNTLIVSAREGGQK
jgi:hypothetical protein